MKNAKMSEFTENDYKAYGDGLNKILDDQDEARGYRHIRGVVNHELGYVHFNQYKNWPTDHRHSPRSEWKVLTIRLYHEGRILSRHWNAWYGDKTIARLANEFIEEVKG